MTHANFAYQPTLRQLLNAEALAEAQVSFGENLLDRSVSQVVSTLVLGTRPGSLYVNRPEALSGRSVSDLRELAGIIVISSVDNTVVAHPAAGSADIGSSAPLLHPVVSADAGLKRLINLATEAEVPLIVLPGFGDAGQIADDVRLAFLRLLKLNNTRLHAHLLTIVMEDGLEGLVEEVSNFLNRPVIIETSEFKLLASRNMSATPANQQQSIADEISKVVRQVLRGSERGDERDLIVQAVKVGRRLIAPIVLGESVVGYVSSMVRPNDDMDAIVEYLRPAALAAMVDFHERRKDSSVFAVTHRSLLKDLLSGHVLSAADQERLEQHYGLDLCDGMLVFAVEALNSSFKVIKIDAYLDDKVMLTEVEGTRAVVVPCFSSSERTWQQEAHDLVTKIKEALKSKNAGDAIVKVGAGRLAESSLDLPDSYREARQALIVGSMIHGDGEFVIDYGSLGVKRLLYLMIDHPELERFYQENLAPLEAYDEEWESELVPSLRVYLDHGANLNSAARALFIHRHTLRYRLEQIAEILKVDIDSQEVLLNLQISYQIRDMKGGGRK